MSYTLNVLSGNPIGYWEFNGNGNDYFNNNNFTMNSVSYSSPPIIANSGSALNISYNSSASLSNSSGFVESLSKNFESNTFCVTFWFSLDNQLDGSGYGTNPINPNNENRLSLFEVNASSTNILKVYYDYISNTVRASVAGTNNVEAYAPLRIMDKQNFVAITYSNGKLLINLNGLDGVQGIVYDKSIMSSYTKTQLSFWIPNSIYSSSQKINHYLINGLAFYDRKIKDREISNIIRWGFNDGKPTLLSKISNKKSFTDLNLININNTILYNFKGTDFINRGFLYNLNSSNSGLYHRSIDDAVFSGSSSLYSISGTSGISWSGENYLRVKSIFNYIKMYGTTITAQITRSSNTSDYVFSISNVNGLNLYLLSGSSSYSVGYYDNTSGSNVTVLSSTNPPSVGSANVGVTFANNNIYLYSSDAGTASISLDSTSQLYNMSLYATSDLYVGNNIGQLSNLSASIKNIGFSDIAVSDFSTLDFTQNNKFMLKLTSSVSPLTVSQFGFWQTSIPPTNDIWNGTIIKWSSMDNCQVFTSTDGGTTFNLVKKNSPIPDVVPGNISKPLTIKVVINTDYSVGTKTQTFNNLSIANIKEFDHKTDLAFYNISPLISQDQSNPVMKINNLPITANPSNFGIKFTGSPTYISASSQIATHKGIEFWYRADNISSSAVILSTSSGPGYEPYVYISSSSYIFHNASALYVNGSAVNSGSYLIKSNVPYHIVAVLSASTSQNYFNLNGDPTISNSSGSATYGFVNVWVDQPSSSQVYSAYSAYISPQVSVIQDDNSSKIVPDITQDSVFAYKIG